jgi:hypothetical protein
MSTWSNRMLGAVSWVTVVAVSAALVWVVISRAGSGLVHESGTLTPPSSSTASVSEGAPSGTTTTGQQGTWQGEAGVVTAVCQSSEIALVGAQPEEDVVVRVLDRGPDQLTVAFRSEGGPVTVVARCRDGRPDFSVSATASQEAPSPQTPTGSGGDGTSGSDDRPRDD